MLQNALNDVKAFNDIKVSEQVDIAKGHGSILYNDYVSLVQNVASNFDAKRSPRCPHARQAHSHALASPPDITDPSSDLLPYDPIRDCIEESFGSFQVHATQRRPPFFRRPGLRKDVWQSLSKADQLVWDQLSNSGKLAILQATSVPSPRSPSSDPPRLPPRQSNLHESPSDTNSDDDVFLDATEGPPTHSDPASTSLLIQAATRQAAVTPSPSKKHPTLPPADIHCTLSQPNKGIQPPVPPHPIQQSAPTYDVSRALTYHVSWSSLVSHKGALID